MADLKRAMNDASSKVYRLYLGLKGSLRRFLAKMWTFTLISIKGISQQNIGSQAAALSYYSLMSLGPLVALAVLASSFVFKDQSEVLASELLTKAIVFIAPSMSQLDAASANTEASILNPELIGFIDRLVRHAQSSQAGFLGTALLIGICIQLIITIEKALNGIWSTPQGRPLFQRITAYWAFLSLGTMLGFVGFSFFSKSVSTALLEANLPATWALSKGLGLYWVFYAPKVVYFFGVVGVLALFYRYLPYTLVHWQSALFGGFIAAGLLFINNYLSFLYIQKALQDQSLYGSIGIIFVFMFGLFVFWWILLLGGLFSYVFQHKQTIKSLKTWERSSLGTQELVHVGVFLYIARCFQGEMGAPSALGIAQALKLPLSVVERSLTILCQYGLLNSIQAKAEDLKAPAYQPKKPLDGLTLMAIKAALCRLGEDKAGYAFIGKDPLLKLYQDAPSASKAMLEPLSGLLNKFEIDG